MDTRLLLLEPNAPQDEGSLLGMLQACDAGRCERVGWDGLLPQRLDAAGASLIVAVSGQHPAPLRLLFERLRAEASATPTLAVVPAAPADGLLKMLNDEADDVLFAPVRAAELAHRVRRLLPTRPSLEVALDAVPADTGLVQLVGRSPAFAQVTAQLPRLARSGAPVLVTGETGTGKELCARAIHFLGARRDAPFVAVDCGAIPDHLFENELFGHARGAYTDAHRDQRGLIAVADGGTLFLDEVDALSLTAQTKVLRFLQERTYRPLGSDRMQRADVSVIAATNRDLEAMVAAKQFRPDLFYRLNVLRLQLPALRERRPDIGLLAAHFLEELRARGNVTARAFAPIALHALALHDWPGNVRELANLVHRASVACEGTQILPCHLSLPVPAAQAEGAAMRFHAARAAAVASFERHYVQELLRKHQGNVTRAAREAGKERRVFGRLVKKYGIARGVF